MLFGCRHGRPRWWLGPAQGFVDLAGDVALEIADDLLSWSCPRWCGGPGKPWCAGRGPGGSWRSSIARSWPAGSPPRLSRWRTCLPAEASTGLAPHRAAKLASLRTRPGLPPVVATSVAATFLATPCLARNCFGAAWMTSSPAAKHRSTVTAMARKHRATIATPYGPRRCFEARVERDGRKPLVARFGGIPLRRQKKAVLTDRHAVPGATRSHGKELISRLRAGRCELCEQRAKVRVHQVRKLADLANPGRPQPAWAQLMARRRRKTLVVCSPCHDTIHARQPAATPSE